MADQRPRWWSASAAYIGRPPVYLGSVIANGSEDARGKLLMLWSEFSPHPAPDRIDPVPGRLVLVDDADG